MRKFFLVAALAITTLVSATEVAITRYNYDPWQGTSEWTMIGPIDGEDKIFKANFAIETLVSGKKYELGSDSEFTSAIVNLLNGAPQNCTAADFTWTQIDAEHISIDANLTSASGTYHLTYADPIVGPATDTTALTISKGYAYDRTSSSWYCAFEGSTTDYAVQLTCTDNTGDIVGEYEGLGEYNDMNTLNRNSTKLWRVNGADSTAVEIIYAHAKVSQLPRGQYQVEAYLQDKDNHGYAIAMTTVQRPGTEDVNISGKMTMAYKEQQKQWAYTADNGKYGVSIWTIGETAVGEYWGCQISTASIYRVDTPSEWSVLYDCGYIVVSEEDGETMLKGELLMEDGIMYHIEFSTKEGYQAIVRPTTRPASTKLLRHGTLVIRMGETEYSVLGQQ